MGNIPILPGDTNPKRSGDKLGRKHHERTGTARRTESVSDLNFSRMSFNEEDIGMEEVGMEESLESATDEPKPESEKEPRSMTFGRYENRRDEMLAQAAFEFGHGDENSYRNVDEAINNAYWKFIAKEIDEYSRIFFPVGYAIFLGVVWPMAYKMEEL